MSKTQKKYMVAEGQQLTNEKTKKVFYAGDIVTEKDFPKTTINHWINRRYLKEVK